MMKDHIFVKRLTNIDNEMSFQIYSINYGKADRKFNGQSVHKLDKRARKGMNTQFSRKAEFSFPLYPNIHE